LLFLNKIIVTEKLFIKELVLMTYEVVGDKIFVFKRKIEKTES